MPRILYLNSIRPTADGALQWPSRTPSQLAFGAAYFAERGYSLVAPDWRRHRHLLAAVQHVNPFGGLPSHRVVEQLSALPLMYRADLVYAPWDIAGGLVPALARAAHVCDTPMVALLHSPPFSRGSAAARPLWRAFLRGGSALPSFSHSVSAATRAHLAGAVAPALRMGPDAGWYLVGEGPGSGALCVGKSLRDFETAGRAATRAGVRMEIVCSPADVTPAFARFGERVSVRTGGRGLLPPAALRDLYPRARVIAIPLSTTRLMAGYWTLLDAMAAGRPVVMTRTPLVDIDLESEGIGRWVDSGDEDGWAEALAWFEDHPDEAAAMGRRARDLVDGGFDQRAFARQIMDLFDSLLGIRTNDGDGS